MTWATAIPKRPRKLKKTIKYGPAPKGLLNEIRKELRRRIEEPNLDENLGAIGRFAMQADDLLAHVKAPEAVMREEHAITLPGPGGDPSGVETYGATIVRQLIPLIQSYQQTQRETPESLVYAIASARRAGMTDVAMELEKKLVGKTLDGPRPVASDVLPALEACDPVGVVRGPKKRKSKANGKIGSVSIATSHEVIS